MKILSESDCVVHAECEWYADEMACEDAVITIMEMKMVMIMMTMAIMMKVTNSFELVGLAVGSGIFNVSIFHDGHADYTSMPIIVTVEEEPQVCIAGDTDNDGLVNVTDVV